MKLRNLIVVSLAALMAIVSCKETEENLGMPSIKLDGNGTMTFETAGGDQQINLTATRDWMVETDAEWIMVSPESGKASATPQTVTVTALENKGMDRTADVKFTIGMSFQTLTVNQAGPGGSAEKLVIYTNDFDKEEATKTYGSGSSYPYLDQFDGWMNAKGEGSANVTYSYKSMSVRSNSTSNSNYSDYPGSGSNNLFFGSTVPSYFAVKNIALGGATKFDLSFGSEKYSQDNGSVFTNSEFHIWLSADGGNKWVEFTDYKFAGGTTEGRWNLASANFSVPSGTETLSICMQVDVKSSYRMDDLMLVISENEGTTVDFTKAVEKNFDEGTTPGGGNEGGEGGSDSDATAIYHNNFDKTISSKVNDKWPYLDQFDGWMNAAGTGAADVVYKFKSASARASSDNNNIWLPKTGAYFSVQGIALNGTTDLKLSFNVICGSPGSYKKSFSSSVFKVYVSSDNAKWVELACDVTANDKEFDNAVTTFSVPANTASLSIAFEKIADETDGYRIDDVKLAAASAAGTAVDFSQGVSKDFGEGNAPDSGQDPQPPVGEGTLMTISEVLASGSALASGSYIEAVVISDRSLNNLTSKKGLYVQDATAGLQFYLAENHEFNFGDKVKIDLSGIKVGEYNGAVQISGLALANISVISTGNTVEPKKVTVADFLANKYEGQYVAIEGVQVVEEDLARTFVEGEAHTSINVETADGKTFAIFSSKYASYGTEKVPQGSGTIKGISSISKGAMQIIFAKSSDYAGLTGERFGDNAGGDEGGNEGENPGGEVTPPEGGDEGGNEGDNPGGEGDNPGGEVTPPADEASPMTIAEVLASGSSTLASGSYIEAVVISDRSLNNLTSKKGLYVQDATAGLQFYLAENHEFNFGDKVKIDLSGITVGAYNGAVQVSGLALANISVISSGNAVDPKKVTVADFLANKYEGQYVAIEGVQVVKADLSKTFVEGESHTSINLETADGKTFAVFSSKYATYGDETVPKGSGTIKGISSINNGAMQIIFAQASDYAGLTGERFGDNAGGDEGGNEGENPGGEGDNPGGEVTPPAGGDEGGNEGSDGSATTTVVFDWSTLATETNQAYTGTTVDGVTLTGSDIATNKAGQLRIYASKGVITLNSGTKKMTKIEFTFTSAEYTGVLEAEGYSDGIWTGNASEVTFSNTGKQARVKKMVITLTE